MSLLDDLARDLSGAADALPLPTLRAAARSVHDATAHLRAAAAMTLTPASCPPTSSPSTSSPPTQPSRSGLPRLPLARLGAAATHLEAGVWLLSRVCEELASYLAYIGAPVAPPGMAPPVHLGGATDGHAHASGDAPACASVAPEEWDAGWWDRRIGEVTAESAPAHDNPATSTADLLHRVTAHVRTGDRRALAADLRAAGPGIGLGLAGAAASALAVLAPALVATHPLGCEPHRSDHVAAGVGGRAPTPADLPLLRARLGIGGLLPGIATGVVEIWYARVCRTPAPAAGTDGWPADTAVAGAVLVGRALAALGRATVDESVTTGG